MTTRNLVGKTKRFLLFIGFNIVAVLLIFFLCEGLASVLLFLQRVTFSPSLAERQHTEYDEMLGWVNQPSLYIEDMYGPGLDLQTNAQGFRNRQDFSREAPSGQLRAICSGDSFTLGYGVGTDQTWCQQLATLDERLQTVNMGQGGYGIGQAYLWYQREGTQLAHDIHLFAFITIDFERMQQTEFLGYGKPRLQVSDGELVVENVPVPQRAFYLPWLTHNRQAIQQLASVQWLSQFFQEADDVEPPREADHPPSEVVAAAILKELLRLNEAQDSTLVLVYLPTLGDYEPGQNSTDVWRDFLALAARDTGVVYLDLVAPFRQLPPDQAQALFIPEGALDFPGAAGHYSIAGNEFMAGLIYEALLALPEISTQLAELEE